MVRILLVEDSVSMRHFVRAALEGAWGSQGGVEITEATNGFDALRLLPRARYDLVISDINMPDVNGLELVQFIRKSDIHRNTPIILISTQTSDRDRARGVALGANAYLTKPFEATDLTREVMRQLSSEAGDGHG